MNAGSVGLPANDGTSDGWYCLLEPGAAGLSVSWHRLNYDWQLSQQRMQQAGLCDGYDACLESGLWPSLDVLPPQERGETGQRIELAPLLLSASGFKGLSHNVGHLRPESRLRVRWD